MSASGSRGAGFGLDAELARKQAAKRNPAREAACLRWIESVTGEAVGDGPFGETLKNGQLLVKLINKIKVGSVKKMETSGLAFKQMENISNFLRACRAVGVEEYEVFETVDLYEEKDLSVVVDCLYALSRTAQKKVSSFQGPYISSDETAPLVSVFECTQGTKSSTLDKTDASNLKSTAKTVDHDMSGKTTKPQVPPPKPSVMSSKVTASVTQSKTPSAPVNGSGSTVAIGTRGAGFGLDADLAKKQAAKYDASLEQAAITWIEDVTKRSPLIPQGETLATALKSGEVLCHLANEIRAGSVKKINSSKMPFKQMENISAFLKACRALGVQEYELFETVDLFEEKDMTTVLTCLHALGRTIQVTVPEYTGPSLGPRMAHENKRDFTRDQLTRAQQDAGMTRLSAGSFNTMERSQISTAGNVTFGADQNK